MFAVCLRQADHVRFYSIVERPGNGWEIKREEDSSLKTHAWCRDWHRVERALAMFRREIADLTRQGWHVQ